MGRTKIGIAVAGVIVTLSGVGAAVAMRSDSGANYVSTANPVTSTASAEGTTPSTVAAPISPAVQPVPRTGVKAPAATGGTPPTTRAPSRSPATATAPASVPRTPQEIQQFVAGLTAQLQAAPSANGTVPALTKEQVEAQVRAQLKQLGIIL